MRQVFDKNGVAVEPLLDLGFCVCGNWTCQTDGKLLQQVVPLAHEFNKKPLLVKVSPDPAGKEEEQHSQEEEDAAFLDKDQEWHELDQLLLECQVYGIVVCNTTTLPPPHLLSSSHLVQEHGGLSGKPLKDHAT